MNSIAERQPWIRWACAVAAATALMVTAGPADASPATAQPAKAETPRLSTVSTIAAGAGCGSDCNETDPSEPVWSSRLGRTVTCANDAITAHQVALKEGITLQLRYSPLCRTVWARFWGGNPGWTYVVSVYSDSWNISYHGMTEVPAPGGTWRNWSDQMDDAGITAKACIGYDWNRLNNVGCTGFY
ncbi:DUF2690 domain-containing protein [Streptomyces bluensis]|uniref:DUF2690 domain-containing protein n=1 Tax=Streptomyces bluensis TaxID=33897 RepID=UPI00167416A8|nr:DUF2690 domain-containing protein [Streptomyces bluensis]GGZ80047.1 hypothetical protein GCM10010344_53960 [Streptomyces bluensis]